MTAVAEALKTQLGALPIEDRAELASFLLASLDEGADPDAEAAWDAELARRAEEIRSGRAQGEPAEEVFARLRERLG
jgi:putative addiction module component (TIGR02574 family)